MQLGCCVSPTYLKYVVDAGFDYAELACSSTLPSESTSVWNNERDQLLALGVPIRGFNVLMQPNLHVVGPDVDVSAIREYLDIVLTRVAELGGEHISFGSGRARKIPRDFEPARAENQLLEFLALFAELSAPYSIQINLEFLRRAETNFINSLLEAKRFVERIHSNSIKILADFFHMMEEEEPISDLYLVSNHVGYVHVADTGRLYPGSGLYPYNEFLNTLRRIGYDGPISVECQWGDVESELRLSAEFLRQYI
ncbi:sugar phosphate isomerase/epimerase family protein [Alicyclobacillus fastidiosus]|uniref:sugar phosphate isomerase/epimerase family protein n=1 Tax=Alicyclobacillus fastidiosus TaxID=392011 RepID=UPI0023E909DF|nr:sugar phosphate isomerase/epimerase [Alicyclobacillus fastidiosus]GMA61133.1 hypothetical protein GCM10025859_15730 [Alicyclobacillus fastidiosus]